ncbi:unnamed protein product, partial [Prorocentrum cordatum]
CCDFIWDERLPLARLQRARQKLEAQLLEAKPSWRELRGPAAASWMCLLRIGWAMHCSLLQVTDEGEILQLLQTPPNDLAVAKGARAGQLRELRAGASRDVVKRCAVGCLASAVCPFCPGDAPCAKGHPFYERPRILTRGDNGDGGELEELPEKLLKLRDRIKDGAGVGIAHQDHDRFESVVGLPLLPQLVRAAALEAEARCWGDWESPLNSRSAMAYHDRSGFDAARPELCRCGWAAVQLGDHDMLVGALFGALPGRRQAFRRTLRPTPRAPRAVADSSALAAEIESQGPELASARGQCAEIWRGVFDQMN